MVNFSLNGKVAVITGGAGILCSEMAYEIAESGAKVAVLDLFKDKADLVADRINSKGGTAIGVGANVLDKNSLEDAKNEVLKAFDRVDILINGAGGNKKEATTSDDMSFFGLPADAMQWVFNLNFMGTVLTTQVFGELFSKQSSGCVINISSMSAISPLTNTIAYSAAKAAVSNFTQWMAVHFNQKYSTKIRVNAIAPGFLLTDQNRYLLTDLKTGESTSRGGDIIRNTPMARYGTPDELVGAVIWLASEAASFVNGAIIPIDGGFSAFSGV